MRDPSGDQVGELWFQSPRVNCNRVNVEWERIPLLRERYDLRLRKFVCPASQRFVKFDIFEILHRCLQHIRSTSRILLPI